METAAGIRVTLDPPTYSTKDHRRTVTQKAQASDFLMHEPCDLPMCITVSATEWSDEWTARVVAGPFHERDARGSYYCDVGEQITLSKASPAATAKKLRSIAKRVAKEWNGR